MCTGCEYTEGYIVLIFQRAYRCSFPFLAFLEKQVPDEHRPQLGEIYRWRFLSHGVAGTGVWRTGVCVWNIRNVPLMYSVSITYSRPNISRTLQIS